ncbi:MAG: sulfatase-like hydrolase/transferase [Acidobacteria bacterium]|nr:sulfatase-like hydrolase/transferase [Acidobacteriota bacterium]
MVTRRRFLATAAAPALKTARRPNVVMFMTDDHGAWALGAYGCPSIHTPNIDTLAAGGARFTRAFACTPVCSPSRLSYITGLIPSRHGVQDWLVPEDSYGPATHRFLDGHVTYSEILARSGYTLGMCGKWHMGDDEKAQRGFTYWHTVPGGGGIYRDPTFVTNGVRRKLQGYKTDLVADGALEFLDTVKDRRPFYLLLPFYAPHTPYNYQPEKYREPYRDSTFPCYPDTPMHPWQNSGLAKMHGQRENKLAYSALITGADANIGRVLKRLEELGMREDTLVIFTADQGWNAGHHGVWGKGNGTVPFNMLEESLRVPLIWNFPGRIRAGQVIDAMVSSYDYFPTILDYLGAPGHRERGMPGRSYAGFLTGKRPQWRNRLYFEYAYVRGVRTENMKYIQRTREWPSELFDLENDPGETHNVIADPAYRRVLAGFRAELAGFFRQAGAPPIEDWHSTTKQKLPVYRRARPQ